MASNSTTFCCLVSIVVVLSFSVSCSAQNIDFKTQSRINHICHETDDYYTCRDILNSHLLNKVSDFKALTQIAIAQTLIYNSETIIDIRKFQNNETEQTQKALFGICNTSYGLLQNQFVDASLDFAKNDIRATLFDMQNCERFVNDCEKVLGNKVTEMHAKNKHMRLLVRMSNVSCGLIGQDVI